MYVIKAIIPLYQEQAKEIINDCNGGVWMIQEKIRA